MCRKKYGTAEQETDGSIIRRMRFAWWITKVKDMHSEYVILVAFHILTATRTCLNPYPTAFPYGNGMVLYFYQQQESSTTKTVHKVINKGLKTYV